MSETTDTDNTNTVSRLGSVIGQGRENGSTSTHQRSCVLARDGIGNLENEVGLPDTIMRERTLVQVVVTVQLSLRAESVLAN